MRPFTFTILLLAFINASGQVDLDSLYSVWYDESVEDSSRFQALESIAWDGYMFRVPDSAFVIAEIGYELAREKGLDQYMAICRNAQGVSFGVRHQYKESIPYFEEVVDISKALNDSVRISRGYQNIGTAYMRISDYPRALENFFRCLPLVEARSDDVAITHVLMDIGIIYKEIEDYESARSYFERAVEISKRSGNTRQQAYSYGNLGNVYKQLNLPKKALDSFRACLSMSKDEQNAYSIPRALVSIGVIHLRSGQLDSAAHYFEQALPMSIEIDDPEQLSILYSSMGEYHRMQGDHQRSRDKCMPIYERVKEKGMLEEQAGLCKCLFLSYKGLGDVDRALQFHEEWFQLTDSLKDLETTKKVQQLEFTKIMMADSLEQVRVVQTKDLELAGQRADLRSQRIGLAATGGGVLLLGLLAFFIRKGKKRSDELLHNILPEEVAAELKQKGKAQSKRIDKVTVLFTDFKGFTAMSEQLTPKELVEDLNICFSEFDRITAKYGIEKIKTIGDAYMAAGGLPTPNTTHATDVIKAALEMRDFVEAGKAKKIEQGLPYFEIRIGVHTGPVVAGIVGVKKFQYDIWGDTVNTASRMESSGEVGQVNISEVTYELVKDNAEFSFTARGKVQAKGKGEMEMYFVSNS